MAASQADGRQTEKLMSPKWELVYTVAISDGIKISLKGCIGTAEKKILQKAREAVGVGPTRYCQHLIVCPEKKIRQEPVAARLARAGRLCQKDTIGLWGSKGGLCTLFCVLL